MDKKKGYITIKHTQTYIQKKKKKTDRYTLYTNIL